MVFPRRRHQLRNNSKKIVCLREVPHGADEEYYKPHETHLEPYSVICNFPATKYTNHNRDSHRTSKIVIFWGERKALPSLEPEIFVRFFELIFEIEGNDLIVYGIPAQLTDYYPFRAFRFSGRDYSDRSEYKFVKRCIFTTENEKSRLSGQEMMTKIHIWINYDGKWKKNEQGGYIWSCGVNAKSEAILVYKNNLSLEVVANEIRETLGLNELEPNQLKFSYLPATDQISCNPFPIYVLNSKSLRTYLSFGNFGTRPLLHVENHVKAHGDI